MSMTSKYTLTDLDPSIIVEPPHTAEMAVIWLHGLGADGNDFVGILPELDLPENHAVRFIFPNAPVQPVTVNGGMVMRSWYDIYSMTIAEKMDLDSISLSTAVLEALIQQQLDAGIKAENIVIAGFSQGGLIALNAALKGKFDIAGVMALSTYYPQACLDALQSVNNKTPVYMAHGTHDQVIPFAVAEATLTRLETLNCQVEFHAYPMEHSVCMEEVETISSWLKQCLNLD